MTGAAAPDDKLARAFAKLQRAGAFRRKEYDRLRAGGIMSVEKHDTACAELAEALRIAKFLFKYADLIRADAVARQAAARAGTDYLAGEELIARIKALWPGAVGIDVPPSYTLPEAHAAGPDPQET